MIVPASSTITFPRAYLEVARCRRRRAIRIIVGTLSAYIATLSARIILNTLRKRLAGTAFVFAVAFGVTLIIALLLGMIVLVLLNVL